MNNIVNVFLGLMIVYGIGYLLLRLIDGQYNIRKIEAFCLSPIFFYIYILILYAFQSLGISILSNAKIFWIFTIVLWVPVCFLLFKRKPEGSLLARTCQAEPPAFGNILFLLGFLSVILFAGFIAWPSPDVFWGLKGDTERHTLFINQLLTGFTFTHYPPFGLEQFSDYPCLAHINVGFFVRLFNIGVFDAYSIVHILQAVMLPAGIFLLIHRLTHNSAARKETRKQIFEIPKNYDIVKNSINCKANSSGIAIHEGTFWINQGLSGKIYTIDRADNDSFKSNQKNYCNPLHRISCMVWHNEKLWAFDYRNSLLIAFNPETNFM